MAIYRAEQARLSIASEPNLAAYMEVVDTLDETGIDWTAQINQPSPTTYLPAGSRSITFDTASETTPLAVGNYIQIGADGAWNTEVRRIISLGTYDGEAATGTIYVDYPTGFWHDNNEALDHKTNSIPTGNTYTTASTGGHPQGTAGNGGINFATFLPGVYETITTPDLTPELTPQYFLKTTSDRNWGYMYRGKQAFSGSLPNFIMLNGYALKYPFGQVYTTGTDSGAGGSTINQTGGTLVGDRSFTITSATGYIAGDFIQIDTTTNSEVRQIIDVTGSVITLNYPLMIAHANGATCNEVIAPFTHTLIESGKLPSMTWHLKMRDTGETGLNDFIRRYVGGVCNRATLSSDEGEMLRYSWDDVQFVDLVHNQTRHVSVTGDGSTADIMAKSSNMLLDPLGIGGDMPNAAGALSAPSYPTTEPYYFSQGSISFFSTTFARIRNFRLEINNNVEPRYYIQDNGTARIPIEMQEGRREYTLTATIAMEDSASAIGTTASLWKELILEGNYAGTGTAALKGFDISLTFTRGSNDTITITSPSTTATTGFEGQGCFFRRASHNIEQESPIQVEGEIIMRNMSVVVVDALGVYP
jgi:hypothetical protein